MTMREQIKKAIEAQGLSQQKLADMTGIPRPNISRFLSGSADMLSDNVQKVLDALGIKVEEANDQSRRNVVPARATPRR